MAVRSKEQLTVLLKLIDVNKIGLKRKDVSVRHKLWQIISYKLNHLQGAEKDMEGWKRSYYTWRLHAGPNHQKKLKEIIADVPDDNYYYINITEDEASDVDDEPSPKNPTERQKERLDELVTKNREILASSANDEPLKVRMWLNITEELNSIPNALKLTPSEWKKCVDWNKYKVPKGRKPRQSAVAAERRKAVESTRTEEKEHITFEILDNDTMSSAVADTYYPEDYDNVGALNTEEVECLSAENKMPHMEQQDDTNFADEDLVDNLDLLLQDNYDDEGDDELNYKPETKRIKTTPIVQSFRFSKRIVHAVETISSDLSDIKELLKKATNSLATLENAAQQKSLGQEQTNALLKRNCQLLKVLVEYKTGRRSNS